MIETTELRPEESNEYKVTSETSYIEERTQVLNHCDTFAILSRTGDIVPSGKKVQGVYYKDTQYINKIRLSINGYNPVLLSSNIKEDNEMLSIDLSNPQMLMDDGKILQQGEVHIHRNQLVRDDHFHEKIEVEQHNPETCQLTLKLTFGSEFKDIFEIRGLSREKRGQKLGDDYPDDKTIKLSYKGLDNVVRTTIVTFSQPFEHADGGVLFRLNLPTKKKVSIDYSISFGIGDLIVNERRDFHQDSTALVSDILESKSYIPHITTSNEHFTHWLVRSKIDLVSLMADTPTGKYPYAGVPWYNTAFGRDGIITALETLWAAPRLTRDVLLFLASSQAAEVNDEIDAEPGKIFHETRGGEMVAMKEVPFELYYGTIDATPLFVVLAGEYYQRTGDLNTIKRIWPNIQAAMQWVEEYGDLDGDGFVEYKHKSKNGLTNQCWKDSHDSVMHLNGQLADPPIAMCEVQAYTYAAQLHAATIAIIFGEKGLAEKWRSQAKLLKENFNDKFWDKELECYVIALDGAKQPCRVKSSNAGQVLFTGIADAAKAKKVVSAMMKPDMYNGWGIRTLSADELRYNPMSYHNGSVWPHDVALIAHGMGKYGFQREAMQLMTGLFEASLVIDLQRLPELFCGMPRRKGEGPTAYPVACSPQAWSVACVYILLKAILQIQVLPAKKEILFCKPMLPSYLERIRIQNLDLSGTLVSLEIVRHGKDTMVGINWDYEGDEWRLSVIK